MTRQSEALRAETSAMRAIEAAIARAEELPVRARVRVLTWAHEAAGEALAASNGNHQAAQVADQEEQL